MKASRLEALLAVISMLAILSVAVQPGGVRGQAPGFPQQGVVIGDLLYDGYASGDKDEAFSLWNVGSNPVSLNGWHATDGEGSADLSPVSIPAKAKVWIAKEATAFERTFGFPPNYEYGANTDPDVPNLNTTGNLSFSNSGDELSVIDSSGAIVDALCYGKGPLDAGWSGDPIQPYTAGGLFRKSNQLLSRKLALNARLPLGDTDTASDWVQDPNDPILGRRPEYPGWNREKFWIPAKASGNFQLAIAVAPDGTTEKMLGVISGARNCIYYEGYTLENPSIAQALAQKAQSGVRVAVLLEGGPVGGVSELEKWCAQTIENSGGQVYFMVNDRNGAHARFRFLHSKLLIVDDSLVGVGTENIAIGSMPDDPLNDGTGGSRGVWVFTDAQAIVNRAKEIWSMDADPSRQDVFRWNASDGKYGPPPADYTPPPPFDWKVYQIEFPQTLTAQASQLELLTAPEATLRPDGILQLIDSAGSGDEVLLEYLEQQPRWGKSSATVQEDPNVYLEHLIDAARRGARVRLLLDSFFDSPSSRMSNRATVDYVETVASDEGLDLSARLGNPAWHGLHGKMVLARISGKGWIAAGSLNGSEVSCKDNREVVLIAQSDQGFAFLKQVFDRDWANPNHWDDGTDR